MKTIFTFAIVMACMCIHAATPTFNSFNTNHFVVDSSANTIRANTNSANPNSLVVQTQMVQQVGAQVGPSGSNFLSAAALSTSLSSSNFLQQAPVTNWFVLTNGSDANTGTASNSATAFRTIQKAINTVSKYWYTNITAVSIQLGPGIYNENVTLLPYVGYATVTIGNETNANIAPSSGDAVFAGGAVGGWTISKVKLWATNGSCIVSSQGATVVVGPGVNFATANSGNYHMMANNNGAIIISGNYTISGGAHNHLYATRGSVINNSINPTVTLSGTPAFTAFAAADDNGCIAAFNFTFSGSATGKRFDGNLNGVFHTLSSSNATYFPGNTAGSLANGGQYQ